MAGSSFVGRNINADSGNVLNNPIVTEGAYREMLANTEWAGMTTDITEANKGMTTSMVNLGDANVVKSINIAETAGTREARFAYALEVGAMQGAQGQVVPPVGDKNKFLYMNVEIGQIRSPQMPEHSDMERRDGYNTLNKFGGSAAMAQRNVSQWHSVKYDEDMANALFRGASDIVLDSLVNNGLNKDLGGVVDPTSGPAVQVSAAGSFQTGAPIAPENVVGFDGSGNTVTMQLLTDTAAARGYHEDKLANLVYALQNTGTKSANALTRNSLKGLYGIAARMNLRKVKGKNYDYIYWLDWDLADQLIGSFDATADTKYLIGIWKTIAASGKDTDYLTDARYSELALDGILIRPSRRLQGYRPATISGTAPAGGMTSSNTTVNDAGRVIFNANITTQAAWYGRAKGRDYETNTQTVGCGFLLGDSALVEARDGGVTMAMLEGDADTGKSWWGKCWRSTARTVWRGRDPQTVGTLRNEGSILTLSCVTGTNTLL